MKTAFQNNSRPIQCERILISASLIALTILAVYYPFISNELIFDDQNLFNGQHSIYDLAQTPFDLRPRTFPLFTLGFVETIWKSLEVSRLISIAIHIANTLLLCRLTFNLLLITVPEHSANTALAIATLAALFFGLNPAATYGAGYLAQRTTLFATFFSLLSLLFYLRAFQRNAISDLVTATVFYGFSVFSKEHAIMLPAAVLLSTMLQKKPLWQHRKKALIFALLTAVPGIYIVLLLKGLIGAYEPSGTSYLPEELKLEKLEQQWLMSALVQTGEFFRYLLCWLFPITDNMSIDMRVDFEAASSPTNLFLRLFSYLTYIGMAIFFLKQKREQSLIGFGMLFTAILYITEFVSFRLQEPFVLYRSYLWAPGIVFALAGGLSLANKNQRKLTIFLILPLLIFPIGSINRLRSLENNFTAWNDAVAKLKTPSLPGADRIFYNRGNEHLKQKRYAEALADMDRVIALAPSIPAGYIGRALTLSKQGKLDLALVDYQHALERATTEQQKGLIEFNRAGIFHAMSRESDAIAALNAASRHGLQAADTVLQLRGANKQGDILPPPQNRSDEK